MEIAIAAHHGERRNAVDGVELPYIVHPVEVQKKLWNWGIHDPVVNSATLLHDAHWPEGKLTSAAMLEGLRTVAVISKEI